jgi:hypothetical protein
LSTGVGEAVEHTLALRELGNAETVLPLVEVKARLLPLLEVHGEPDPVLVDDGALVRCASPQEAVLHVEALEFGEVGIGATDDPLGFQDVLEGVEDVLAELLQAQGPDLHDEMIGVTVHDQPGEAVSLAVHEPVSVAVFGEPEIPPQLGGLQDFLAEEAVSDLLVPVPGEDPHRDVGLLVDVSTADEAAGHIFNIYDVPLVETAARFLDCPGKYPGMAAPQGFRSPLSDPYRGHEGDCFRKAAWA